MDPMTLLNDAPSPYWLRTRGFPSREVRLAGERSRRYWIAAERAAAALGLGESYLGEVADLLLPHLDVSLASPRDDADAVDEWGAVLATVAARHGRTASAEALLDAPPVPAHPILHWGWEDVLPLCVDPDGQSDEEGA